MKKLIILSVALCSVFLTTPGFAESIFSFSGGSFSPEEEFMSEFDTGFTAAISYTTSASDLFAFGLDVAFSQTEAEAETLGIEYKDTLSTLGVEALIYIYSHKGQKFSLMQG